jgi:hypothetical protein
VLLNVLAVLCRKGQQFATGSYVKLWRFAERVVAHPDHEGTILHVVAEEEFYEGVDVLLFDELTKVRGLSDACLRLRLVNVRRFVLPYVLKKLTIWQSAP